MTMARVCAVALLSLLLGLPMAQAETQVPMPVGSAKFIQADPAARIYFPRLDTERGRNRLARHVARLPEDSRGWSAQAYLAAIEGQPERVEYGLSQARHTAGDSVLRQREALWSEGWVRLQLDQPSTAAAAWLQAMQLHRGRPYWVPYSLAVLGELAGERNVAVAWYALAARSAPSVWGTRYGMQQYTSHWRESEREAIARVYDAWSASVR